MPYRQKITWVVAALGLLILIGLLTVEIVTRNGAENGATDTARSRLTASIGGPFSLIDQTGIRRSEADFAGRPLLIFFGFTYCPDVCPTALDRIGAALDMLKQTAPAQYDALQPIFISVDPARDTPQAMAEYLAYFHPKMIGLTGTEAEINSVKRAFKVYAARAAASDIDGPYMVDHSSLLYLMNGDNKYMAHFNHEILPEKLAAGLRAKLANQ